MTRISIRFFLVLSFLFFNQNVFSSTSEEQELLSVYGGEELISIATGTVQPIAKAPAVATVITAEDIREIGASDLDEVLETVPGLHVSRAEIGYTAMYFIRGIFTEERNQQVLLLLNGVPLTSAHFGNRGNTWGGMPVRNIERVEIIRGPGSALYGADAFAGVINVITKEYDDVIPQAGFRGGSFDTEEAWALTRSGSGDMKGVLGVEFQKTDGHRETISQDRLGSGSPSLAPDPINAGKKSIEAHLDLNYQKLLDLHVAYQRRFDLGTGGGIASALDPEGKMEGWRWVSDLTYRYRPSQSAWEGNAKFSFLSSADNAELVLLPAAAYPATGGMIGEPEVYERHYRGEFSTIYTGFQHHRVRGGLGVTWDDMYRIEEKKNFDKNLAPLAGGVTNAKGNPDLIFIEPDSRRIYFAFLQDEWALARNLDLTLGVRYDDYSDFGHTLNPRAALVWQSSPELTTKVLYGSAFRAPSFSEQGIKNNPVIQGGTGLSPETIKTYEMSVFYKPALNVEGVLSAFQYEMEDILRFSTIGGAGARQAKNTGKQEGYGFEGELSWKVWPTFTLKGNVAYQKSRDVTRKDDAGHAPEKQIYMRSDWQFKPKWSLVPQLNWVIDRKRSVNDTRSTVADYATLDFVVRYGKEKDLFQAALVGRNILDQTRKEPTLRDPTSGPLIPKDLPLPGRAIYLELSAKLE
ncbi:MAG: TonB-dependent receptor [Gammaproteobacteria bacterium]|nr:TonB-dependent receptor [Gammaproteobacteria bacterium]